MQTVKLYDDNSSKTPLKVISIGDGVTKNFMIYEYGEDIIAVDYGIGFPGVDDIGIDFLIPDMSYLLDNRQRVRGLLITHAHADHFGAVPHLLKEFNLPIYANRITQAHIDSMLEEKQFKSLKGHVKYNLFNETTGVTQLGVFKISAFNVNHSVPGSLGIVIDTPEGRIIHMADFKIDPTPVIDPPMSLDKLQDISKGGVLCLVSDSLGSRSKGFVPSERTIDGTFPKVFEMYHNNQLFITTISSNVARIYQIIDAAVKAGRRVVPVGRSIDRSVQIARNLGYLPFPESTYVDVKESSGCSQDSIVYLIAGCFGQHGSALDRLGKGEHKDIVVDKNAIVVFSAEPNPPGVDLDVEYVSSNLVLMGAEVIDHTNMDNLHVSGHGHRDELGKVASIVKPKYFIPNGGTPLQIHAYANMVYEMGVEHGKVFELQEGEVVEFSGGRAKMGKRIEVHDMYFDGTSISSYVINDRRVLSQDGVFVVVVPMQNGKIIRGKVEVITRGFIYVKESKSLMGRSRDVVNKIIDKNLDKLGDWGLIRSKIEKDVEKFLYRETGRNPMIIVHGLNI